jgi:hypothetical protein
MKFETPGPHSDGRCARPARVRHEATAGQAAATGTPCREGGGCENPTRPSGVGINPANPRQNERNGENQTHRQVNAGRGERDADATHKPAWHIRLST